MKTWFKQLIRKTPIYRPLQKCLQRKREVREWEKNGRPAPLPHIIKQKILRKFAKQYNLKVFVETGTYYGEMVDAMKGIFDRVYSIELSQELFEKAKERFKPSKHVELLMGDSGKVLENVMKKIDQPALFWLDGHYSTGVTARGEKDTPIYKELQHILNSEDLRHVIIIDDARCFGNDPAYPTIKDMKEFIHSKRENVQISVEDDSIRIVPND